MTQTEILIYITVIQWTVSIFGGHFLAVGTVANGLYTFGDTVVPPTLLGFLADTFGFFLKAFAFAIPGAPYITPLWWLMGVVWFVLFVNFLRTGLS